MFIEFRVCEAKSNKKVNDAPAICFAFAVTKFHIFFMTVNRNVFKVFEIVQALLKKIGELLHYFLGTDMRCCHVITLQQVLP
ncbi:MAG TPA: hypothetical protein DEA91_28560 [Paenibacillus sp.]|nr:hypothetical protein [Paenibacillus sp.]